MSTLPRVAPHVAAQAAPVAGAPVGLRGSACAVGLAPGAHGALDELPQGVVVDVAEALDVQAPLAGRDGAEALDERGVLALEVTGQVDDGGLLAGCEARERGVPFVAALVAVVVAAEADDAAAPHGGRLA